MAPEQFQGRAVFASDVYSIGVIMYEMMTGSLPYFSTNPRQLEKMAASGRLVPPRERNRAVSREVNEIVEKALAPEVTDRYQGAEALLDDLATVSEIDYRGSRLTDIRKRLKARERPTSRFCWNCRKPLHHRAENCAFCNERQ